MWNTRGLKPVQPTTLYQRLQPNCPFNDIFKLTFYQLWQPNKLSTLNLHLLCLTQLMKESTHLVVKSGLSTSINVLSLFDPIQYIYLTKNIAKINKYKIVYKYNKVFSHTYRKKHIHTKYTNKCTQAWHSRITFTIPGKKRVITLNTVLIRSVYLCLYKSALFRILFVSSVDKSDIL